MPLPLPVIPPIYLTPGSHLTPGGLAEVSEHSFNTYCADDSIPADSPITTYLNALTEGLEAVGLPIKKLTDRYLKKNMENAGFVDVQVRTFNVPWGTWPKDKQLKYMGAIELEIMTTGAEAYGMQVFTRILGIPEDKARKMMDDHVAAIRSGKEHRCHRVWQVVGRKPAVEQKES